MTPAPLTPAGLAGVSGLGLRLVVTAGGPPVRRTHATELLDPGPDLTGGELVCTTGRPLVDDAACRAFTASVAAGGAAGVCLATGAVHPRVPPGLEAACRERGVELLVARDISSFPRITAHLVRQREQRPAPEQLTGQLLELLGRGVVDAEALLPSLVDAGLGRGQLAASAWCPEAAEGLPVALRGAPHLLGVVEEGVLLVTGEGVVLDAVAALLPDGAGDRFGASPPAPWRDLGTGLRRARGELAAATALAQRPPSAGREMLQDLLAHVPAEVLLPFVDRLLLPVVEADRRRESGLLDTLRTYLACDGSLAEVARRQHLHVNSVRHRLTRLRDLTGTDPTTIVGAGAFGVALWAYDRTR